MFRGENNSEPLNRNRFNDFLDQVVAQHPLWAVRRNDLSIFYECGDQWVISSGEGKNLAQIKGHLPPETLVDNGFALFKQSHLQWLAILKIEALLLINPTSNRIVSRKKFRHFVS